MLGLEKKWGRTLNFDSCNIFRCTTLYSHLTYGALPLWKAISGTVHWLDVLRDQCVTPQPPRVAPTPLLSCWLRSIKKKGKMLNASCSSTHMLSKIFTNKHWNYLRTYLLFSWHSWIVYNVFTIFFFIISFTRLSKLRPCLQIHLPKPAGGLILLAVTLYYWQTNTNIKYYSKKNRIRLKLPFGNCIIRFAHFVEGFGVVEHKLEVCG